MLSRALAAYVALSERRAGRLLVIYALVAAAALAAALRLELHTDFAELLPDRHPAVMAFRKIVARQKSATNLVMIVHGPSADADHRFVEALRPELERLIGEHVFTSIEWKPDSEAPAFLSRMRWLYAGLDELQRAEELLDRVIAVRVNPLAADLEGDPEEELRKLRASLEQKLPPPSDSRYYETTDRGEHWMGVMMWRKRDGFASSGDQEMLKRVQAVVARVEPQRFGRVRVEYTGHIAQAIDEQAGIRDDLTAATLICLGGVLLVIYLYFRRVAVLWVVGAPAVLGLLLALALASATVRYLNLNTAFLVSIILGNGINSPIIVMARFGEERRSGRAVAESLTVALRETFAGTLTAMAAAAIAYGSLLATSFRGFNQFGVVGGAGMLLVWVATFALLPPMVIFGERLRAGGLTPRANLVRPAFAALGRAVERAPWAGALVIAAACVLLARPLLRYVREPLEWNFEHLRTEATPSQKLWPRMESLGMGDVGAGRVGNDGVFLVDDPTQAEPVAEAVRQKDAADPTLRLIKTVRTLRSLLPESQDEKLALLARVRAKLDRHRAILDGDEARELEKWRPPDGLHAVTYDELPRAWLDAFTEVDGERGRFIGVDANRYRFYSNNGHDLVRLARALSVEALGRTWVAAGAGSIFAGMLQAIVDDGPRVTLIALAGVTLLVLVMFGPRGALPVLGSLALGIGWLLGALGAWDAHPLGGVQSKLNFVNFVALPITLGVGTDYAANIWARLRRDRHAPLGAVLGDTGSAVALCSLTTIIGYSTLLLSRNHALRSFGLAADLGELTCLVAALIAMPVLVRLTRRRAAE
jgi:uncharacterized protein